MDNRIILTDGMKAANLLLTDDPSVWTYLSNAPQNDQDVLYARVAAAYRAYNLKSNTVGNMPFALLDKSGNEYDNSATWENKVGFLPNPQELFRLNTLSYISTNTFYNLRTSDALGYKTRGLYHAVASTFKPFVNPITQQLEYIERRVGNKPEKYKPEDERLVRMWRLDHTTEVLPSPNTEARAIMSAAGTVYFADLWIKHFYERGGIAPTVIAMKGAVAPAKRDDEEKSWTDWLLKIRHYSQRIARVFNADTLEVKQFGSAVTDLKNNEVYRQAIENIAMATGMPLSLLLANSANRATAQEEKATWYDSDIVPFCNTMAYEYNRQVFAPIKLRLEFRPETVDSQQEDETSRAQAFSTYMDALEKCPTFDVFIGMAETLGLELSESLVKAADAYYKDKAKNAEAIRVQTEQQKKPSQPEAKPMETGTESQPVKWIPTLDELQELKTWRKAALSHFKQGKPLTFEYQPHYGGLPENVTADIKARLAEGREWSEDGIKTTFDIAETVAVVPEQKSNDVIQLAQALNYYADALFKTGQIPVST